MTHEDRFPPYINWGQFKSHDPNKPDVLNLQVEDPELSSGLYSKDAKVYEKDIGGNVQKKKLPIKNHESKNDSLLKQWTKEFHKGRLVPNVHIKIKTWLETSKRHADRMIRRFKLIILD